MNVVEPTIEPTLPQTFWDVLILYRVVIPLIQRDYAQGRRNAETQQIRRDFVDAIRQALLDPDGPPLDLGLIYGATVAKQNGDGAQDERLVLLDGQQRMTTLFLLHWYLSQRGVTGSGKAEAAAKLGRFTYETRVTARDFCRQLALASVDTRGIMPEEGNGSLSARIHDAPWFFRSWQEDPTVRAMLVMLEALHEALRDEDHGVLWRRLVLSGDAPPFVFQFLSMTRYRLTDDLYIKMNSRGQPLTAFEKFKAWLQRHVEHGYDLPLEWEGAMDKEWLDLFWRLYGCRAPDETDRAFLRFLKGVALHRLLSGDVTDEDRDRLTEEVTAADEFMPTQSYGQLFTRDALTDAFGVLRRFCDESSDGFEGIERLMDGKIDFFLYAAHGNSLFRAFTAKGTTYATRVMFHGLCRFLIGSDARGLALDADALVRWMRIVRNLAVNTDFRNPTGFARAVGSLHACADQAAGDFLGWLATMDERMLAGFDGTQVREEKRKAALIRQDPAWEPALADAENHPYFEGRIRFLLLMSGPDQDQPENLATFRRYAGLACRLFVEGGLVDDPASLVQRAMLALGDYVPWVGYNTYDLGHNRAAWRDKILVETDLNHGGKARRWLREMFDRLLTLADQQGLDDRAGLEHIIADGRATDWAAMPDQDWREYFLRFPEAVRYGREGKVRWIYPTERWQDGHYILLLKGSKSAKLDVELRVYCFYCAYVQHAGAALAPFEADCHQRDEGGTIPYLRLSGPEHYIDFHYLPLEQDRETPHQLMLRARHNQPLLEEITTAEEARCARCEKIGKTGGAVAFCYHGEKDAAEAMLRLVDALRAS